MRRTSSGRGIDLGAGRRLWHHLRRYCGRSLREVLMKLVVDGHKHPAKVHFRTDARHGMYGGAAEKIQVFGEH